MRFVMGNKIRFRTAENVFTEIKMLYENYGINYFKIMDDNFTYSKKRTLEICDMITKNNLKIVMEFMNGLMVKTMDKEIIDALCLSGGLFFPLAIESGSDYIRNVIMRKNCSKELIFDVIQNLRKHNVIIKAFFIIGMPEETEETIDDTINMLKNLDIDFAFVSIVNPFPGTALYNQCKRDNLFTLKFDEEKLWNNSIEAQSTMKNISAGLSFFLIKPYNLSLEVLKNKYDELRAIMDIKNKKWHEHMATSEK
jgi:magnesium-protoporphyrin IX monomethyl ester (oxidative) cyclase